jgi:hypothetical protein
MACPLNLCMITVNYCVNERMAVVFLIGASSAIYGLVVFGELISLVV